jgi:plastocyanin
MKKLLIALVVLSLLTMAVVACGSDASSAGTNEVHMNDTNFVQPSITISKGSSLTLIADTSTTHIIQNGTWDNGAPKPGAENGAPTANVTVNGNDRQTIGPFNTAGTFHLYCTVHQNMNLTVIVQ